MAKRVVIEDAFLDIGEALATAPGRPAHARITLVDVLRLRDVGRALAKLPAGLHE